jgi:hypothetical protein
VFALRDKVLKGLSGLGTVLFFLRIN